MDDVQRVRDFGEILNGMIVLTSPLKSYRSTEKSRQEDCERQRAWIYNNLLREQEGDDQSSPLEGESVVYAQRAFKALSLLYLLLKEKALVFYQSKLSGIPASQKA